MASRHNTPLYMHIPPTKYERARILSFRSRLLSKYENTPIRILLKEEDTAQEIALHELQEKKLNDVYVIRPYGNNQFYKWKFQELLSLFTGKRPWELSSSSSPPFSLSNVSSPSLSSPLSCVPPSPLSFSNVPSSLLSRVPSSPSYAPSSPSYAPSSPSYTSSSPLSHVPSSPNYSKI